MKKTKFNFAIGSLFRLLFAVVAVCYCMVPGCMKAIPQSDLLPISFLYITPYIGDEAEIRDPAPEPSRMTINQESVQGWENPPENLLRFPVEILSNARLSMRIGGSSENPVYENDLIVRVEFSDENGNVENLFEIKPSGERIDEAWFDASIDLDRIAGKPGELRFAVEGPIASNPDVKIFWGQPTIYYPEAGGHKNVLLIGIDALRADAIEPLGGRDGVTPGLLKLAGQSTLFTRCHTQASWTLPSFTSILTGLLPSEVFSTVTTLRMPHHPDTLAEILHPEGYATGTICGVPFIGNDRSGFHQGMESMWYRIDESPETSVLKAKEFITRSKDRDWFCFLHIFDPHGDYSPPEEFVEQFCDPAYEGPIGDEFDVLHDWALPGIPPRENNLRRIRNLYDGEVANVDRVIDSFLEWMDQAGLLDDTLVIFTSDHGEEFYEHGGFDHGQSLYEELVHVPLIIRGNGFPEGVKIDTPVASADIFSTILKYLDIPVPEGVYGIPLQDIISVGPENDRLIFGEGTLVHNTHMKYVIQWPYKCFLDFFTGVTMLFNLEVDPGELTDISDDHPEIAGNLRMAMVTRMLPLRTMYIVLISGNHNAEKVFFDGEFSVPGGITDMFLLRGTSLEEGDETWIENDTVSFHLGNPTSLKTKIRGFAIVPEDGADMLEARVSIDGEYIPDIFYPYGNSDQAPDNRAVTDIYDYTWPAQIPEDWLTGPPAVYIIGVPGIDPDELENAILSGELDQETLDELRSLGYIQ